ncbi:MAG: hypothetical protein AAFR61_23645 [Bacteroidota bacterium]
MLRESIRILLSQYDEKIQKVIEDTLDYEQRYISFGLGTNSSKLKEIKQDIRNSVDKQVKK